MIIVEFTVIPLGTGSTSLSDYVAEVCKEVRNSGVRFTVTPMGTIIEGEDLGNLFEVIRKAHEAAIRSGVKRVVTVIKIDDRRDKERKMEDKVEALKKKGVI
ncbi:MAG: MTH1187 family thiamine-binding protein [Candidatus Methanomethyliaceae archaeon]|nr:MTH1187 family thiamine-binding protein [Candidatus Methanomethyliaceae archaeon]MDW7971115.1 MTH1187 family thiamine-binding protein [Nitrososphaerota archaeon]